EFHLDFGTDWNTAKAERRKPRKLPLLQFMIAKYEPLIRRWNETARMIPRDHGLSIREEQFAVEMVEIIIIGSSFRWVDDKPRRRRERGPFRFELGRQFEIGQSRTTQQFSDEPLLLGCGDRDWTACENWNPRAGIGAFESCDAVSARDNIRHNEHRFG